MCQDWHPFILPGLVQTAVCFKEGYHESQERSPFSSESDADRTPCYLGREAPQGQTDVSCVLREEILDVHRVEECQGEAACPVSGVRVFHDA